MVDIERVKSGIPGFDKLVDGGIPRSNLVVLSGDPGSGKTIFSIEFLYKGAKEMDEPGVFVSLEESKEDIIQTASICGWDLQELIKKKMLEGKINTYFKEKTLLDQIFIKDQNETVGKLLDKNKAKIIEVKRYSI